MKNYEQKCQWLNLGKKLVKHFFVFILLHAFFSDDLYCFFAEK